jgi:hypothetical protein
MGNDLVSFEGVEDFFSAIEIIKRRKIGKSDDSVQMTDDSLGAY